MDFYRVVSGDSLYTIGLIYNVTPQAIAHANGLNMEESLVVGMNLVIPTNDNPPDFKPTIETFGYYLPASDPDGSLIRSLGQYLTYLGLFDFPITESGEIIGTIDPNILSIAREQKVLAFPVLTNLEEGNFSSDLGRAVISNPEILNTFINNIMALLDQYDLPGIMVDFENLYPEDRDLFTNFIRLLFERLHRENKLLGVNVAAKWEDLPEAPWAGFFDYRALAPYMDLAAIMTYEWGYRGGPPSPTAPLPFVRRVLDYAIASGIPPSNIVMGMTNYGYNWPLPYSPENPTYTVTLDQIWDIGRLYNVPILFDDEVKQPYIDYFNSKGVQHIAWFEDALSHYYKYQLAREYGLKGVFHWTINLPLQATWYIVSNMFNIRKLDTV